MIGIADEDDMFLYNVSAEQFVPEDHPLRRIRPLIDIKKIRKLARPLYLSLIHISEPTRPY